ncbi:lysine N(6)-hydroxylase/L-ornithine N(5)-oxygenase family protein [Streptomyces sp. NPDC085946]|uniref:lysine N(6)-hydroxylase/L-ornithine N(5)-oxygenase family protein n=1 Tax=Streptomyces sp. NPDC085946 TaxID=3365744 RepID=UPI0037D365CC
MTSPAPHTPAAPPPPREPDAPRDLVGIGIGPFNLSLAALAHPLTALDAVFYDQRPAFTWHPGLLLDGTTVHGSFLADLVTLADPASPWTFLSYLKDRERLYPFCFAGRLHIQRAEYDAYCRWVAERLPGLRFGHRVDAVRWNPERGLFEVDHTRLGPDGEAEAPGRTCTRNVVLGIGSEPHVPEPLRPLADAPGVPVLHAADYLRHRDALLAADHVTVVGTGQSGAEIFLDLLRHRPAGRERVHWLGRTEALAPTECSKLGLEHFTPDYTRYFHALAEPVRDRLAASPWQMHGGIGADTLAAIHDELYRRSLHGGWPDAVLTPGVRVRTAGRIAATRIELHLEHVQQDTRSRLTTGAVVLATGYRERPLDRVLAGLDPYLRRDGGERPRVDAQHRLVLDPSVTGTVYVQNAGNRPHGVGAPDLGLAAWRSATILNSLTGKESYPLPRRTAFTTFGLDPRPQVPPARRAPELIPLLDDRRQEGRPRPGAPRTAARRNTAP